MMPDGTAPANQGAEIATLFIRIQQYKDACWKAHIARRHRDALELSALLQAASEELTRRLAK